jgi:hypothetical protein
MKDPNVEQLEGILKQLNTATEKLVRYNENV